MIYDVNVHVGKVARTVLPSLWSFDHPAAQVYERLFVYSSDVT